MKFHEPSITALFLLLLVSTIYLVPIAENSTFFSEVSREMTKENVGLEIPNWADFTVDIAEEEEEVVEVIDTIEFIEEIIIEDIK